jgi:hypothetical protein
MSKRSPKKYALCFVDDDPDERARFKKYLKRYYFIGVGNTFQQAERDLKKTYKGGVDLFVLDMYFPTKENTDADRIELDKKWEKFCIAENRLQIALTKMGQSVKGGSKLAKEAQSRKKQFVFFTRKGNLDAAIEAYEDLRALSVIKKPDPEISNEPREEKQIKNARDKAMKNQAYQIYGKINSAIRRASPSLSGQAFVAMWFTEILDAAYNEGIKYAIETAGYKPVIIRLEEHANIIIEEIIAKIRNSTFVVADFTGHRRGVYFEAGFARGLDIPVIWTCHKDEFQDVHFDIKPYKFIVWTTPADLAKKLKRSITEIVGRGRRRTH